MKLLLAIFALFLAVSLVGADIVEKNIICIEEIKALESCLNDAGQGQGWCEIGKTVIFLTTIVRQKFKPVSETNLFADSAKATAVCETLKKKMNECIIGKAKA